MVWKVQRRKGSQGASRILAISSLVILYFSKIAIFSAFIRLQFSSLATALFWPVLPKKGSHWTRWTVQWGRKAHALHRKGNLKKNMLLEILQMCVKQENLEQKEIERERGVQTDRLYIYMYWCTYTYVLIRNFGKLICKEAKTLSLLSKMHGFAFGTPLSFALVGYRLQVLPPPKTSSQGRLQELVPSKYPPAPIKLCRNIRSWCFRIFGILWQLIFWGKKHKSFTKIILFASQGHWNQFWSFLPAPTQLLWVRTEWNQRATGGIGFVH